MRGSWSTWFVLAASMAAMPVGNIANGAEAASLPSGVKAVWELDKAHRQSTPTRERICINGLWRWQPAKGSAQAPENGWGHFKVPGAWPGITNYMQKDSQTVHRHADWKDVKLADVAAAWYQREITIPRQWKGRRVALQAEYVNSLATVWIDDQRVGDVRFPAGQLDLTSACRPGETHVLSMLVTALPLKGVMQSYVDTAAAREVKGAVARRGLCGDVYLIGEPTGPRIANVNVVTSVRRGEITLHAEVDDLDAAAAYGLRVRIADGHRTAAEFAAAPQKAGNLANGRITLTQKWRPEKLWDLHTPENHFEAHVSLVDGEGKELDAALPVRFGFREFWIDGRDFRLNGSRIGLSAVPLDNAQVGAASACYGAARESFERLKSFGINFVYAHNYDCEPGAHLSYEEVLRAADDVGMLVALTQPHFSHYDWNAADADATNGYAGHAAFYARVAGNHPSVIAYATSHNATASGQDMNPDRMGAAEIPREGWAANNAKRAERAEALIRAVDPSRIVYHHAGDIGALHASNFYPNFVPVQEMSDWFETWAAKGAKPVFLCEYGAPFSWDWAMYRGWFGGKREFGSANVPWEFCLAEWNSQFLGDGAYRISEREKANLRWEARQARRSEGWRRWDYPTALGSNLFDERQPVLAQYMADNWRAFRTWGLSANSPWEHQLFWKLRDGVDKSRKELPVDWDALQRPGISPDFLDERYERMDLAFERDDWIATPAAEALYRNNRPLLAYIAGKPVTFTSKDHNFLPGETVEKQVIVINNGRVDVACDCTWTLALPKAIGNTQRVNVPVGEQVRVPLNVVLPNDLRPGVYRLSLTAAFDTGESQADHFSLNVLPLPPATKRPAKVALYDPKGETARLLKALGVLAVSVEADADLTAFELLIVGKGALTPNGPAPNLDRVREGLKVLVFEQTSEALEQRLGFRVQEYGLRQVFPRVPDHAALDGLTVEHLADWRGAATLLPPRLYYRSRPMYGPTIDWCGLPVSRIWRCGTRGSVASVLIEKPARGDFLPLVDGGYSLQYAPLLEYREGQGVVLFCQLDVTGRTESDPAAERIARNLLGYMGEWKPSPRRTVVYVGEPAGRAHLERAGIRSSEFAGSLKSDETLVVGPNGGATLAPHKAAIAAWLKQGGRVLAIGLDEAEARSFLPLNVGMKRAEHIAVSFEPAGAGSPLTGIGPADAHNRDPRELNLVSSNATLLGNGVLAVAGDGNIVFCQLVPWQFDEKLPTRRTFRRTSCLLSRLLGNMGVGGETPLLARFAEPLGTGQAPNLLHNGELRTDANDDGLADGWQFSVQPLATAARERLDSGDWAQRLALPASASTKPASMMFSQADVPMEKGQWYRITLRAKWKGDDEARVSLAVQSTTTWRPFFDNQEFKPDAAWKPFAFVVESNASAVTGTKFQIWHGTPGTLWLADLRMEPCDPPTQGRWLEGFYLDRPEEWDDPYRFFRW
jgi:hypothetical protein